MAATIPGEAPEEELALALGGETSMLPLHMGRRAERGLVLVTLADAAALGLRRQYLLTRRGLNSAGVYGDCIVAAMDARGGYADVTPEEGYLAAKAILPAGGGR